MSFARTSTPLVRPFTAPRAVACPHQFYFSTASRSCARQSSQTSSTCPLSSSHKTQTPSIQICRPVFQPQRRAHSQSTPQTSAESSNRTIKKDTVTSSLPPPRYFVSRSATKNLPVYTDFKRGGNLRLTTVRKITGDLQQLRDDLRAVLNVKEEDVKINQLTRHVIVKGHYVPQVMAFLTSRGM